MRKLTYVVFAVPAILALALIGLWWTAADLDRPIDFRKTILVSTPNQYLVCPPDYCADTPHALAPRFPVPGSRFRSGKGLGCHDEQKDRFPSLERE